MLLIRRDKWALVRDYVTGKKSASVECPKCGNMYYLDHTISDDGNVTPSLVCPFDNCDFHEFVVLEDWKGE
jgi:hypothetical protein